MSSHIPPGLKHAYPPPLSTSLIRVVFVTTDELTLMQHIFQIHNLHYGSPFFFLMSFYCGKEASLVAQTVKDLPAIQETWI